MGLFFIHIIKSSLCLIAFYTAYKLLLSKETFHKVNRFILLAIIIVSMLVPFIELTISQPDVALVPAKIKNIEHALIKNQGQLTVSSISTTEGFYLAILCMYAIGVLVQFIISSINFIKIYRLASQAEHVPFGKYIIAITDKDQSPFSWGKYIVISKNEYDSRPEIIIQHELMHLKRLHSADLLLTELTMIFFWFNPVVRLLIQELKDTHEFEVDDALIQQGVDAKEYQLLLIKKAAGNKLYSIANSFNQSKISVRIKMMLRQRSNPWSQLKYLCIIALTCFSVIAFAKPDVANHLKNISSAKVGKFLKKQVTDISDKISGTETEEKPIEIKQVGVETAKPKPELTAVDNATAKDQEHYVKAGAPLCIVDNKAVLYNEFKLLNPDDFKTVKILKEKEATDIYGDKGKNGAIVITMEKATAAALLSDNAQVVINMINSTSPKKPKIVFFLKGDKVPDQVQTQIITKFEAAVKDHPEAVESMITIMGKAAVDKYGDDGIYGVLEVHLASK